MMNSLAQKGYWISDIGYWDHFMIKKIKISTKSIKVDLLIVEAHLIALDGIFELMEFF